MKANTYYSSIKDHVLEEINTGVWDTFRMYNPKYGKYLMGVTITFSPNGIIITGDFAPGNRGINSVSGYNVGWFSSKKSSGYLAEKFIGEKTYDGDRAFNDWEWFQKEYGMDDSEQIQAVFDDPDYEYLEWKFEYHVYGLFEKHLGAYWDYPFGYDYDENKLDHLVAIQQRFMELYQEAL